MVDERYRLRESPGRKERIDRLENQLHREQSVWAFVYKLGDAPDHRRRMAWQG